MQHKTFDICFLPVDACDFSLMITSKTREKGKILAVHSSLVLSVISKNQFLAYYIDDSNARPLGDAKTEQKCQHWFHIF